MSSTRMVAAVLALGALALAGPAWGQQDSELPEECSRLLGTKQRLDDAKARYGIASRLFETQAVSESVAATICAGWAEKNDQVDVALTAWNLAWLAEKFRAISLSAQLAAAQDKPTQQDKSKTPVKLPELTRQRPECGLLLPARDERRDVARLVRADQFLDCERDGFPKHLAPPWKDSEEGTKKLSDACEYFAAKAVREYPEVGQANLNLAADRCRINIMQIILEEAIPR